MDSEHRGDLDHTQATFKCKQQEFEGLVTIESNEEFEFLRTEIERRVKAMGQKFVHEQWWTAGIPITSTNKNKLNSRSVRSFKSVEKSYNAGGLEQWTQKRLSGLKKLWFNGRSGNREEVSIATTQADYKWSVSGRGVNRREINEGTETAGHGASTLQKMANGVVIVTDGLVKENRDESFSGGDEQEERNVIDGVNSHQNEKVHGKKMTKRDASAHEGSHVEWRKEDTREGSKSRPELRTNLEINQSAIRRVETNKNRMLKMKKKVQTGGSKNNAGMRDVGTNYYQGNNGSSNYLNNDANNAVAGHKFQNENPPSYNATISHLSASLLKSPRNAIKSARSNNNDGDDGDNTGVNGTREKLDDLRGRLKDYGVDKPHGYKAQSDLQKELFFGAEEKIAAVGSERRNEVVSEKGTGVVGERWVGVVGERWVGVVSEKGVGVVGDQSTKTLHSTSAKPSKKEVVKNWVWDRRGYPASECPTKSPF